MGSTPPGDDLTVMGQIRRPLVVEGVRGEGRGGEDEGEGEEIQAFSLPLEDMERRHRKEQTERIMERSKEGDRRKG